MIKEDHLEFSFSGLKSAFINLHHNAEQKGDLFFVETTGREVLMIPQGDYEMISFVIEGSMGLTHSQA